jgi:predicted secreted acid phosphatase
MTSKIIVFDIDGTVANIVHRRQYVASKPKNWPAFNAGMANDTVYADVKFIYDTFKAAGNRIIFCSGRSDDSRDVTTRWLHSNGFDFEALFMRRAGDYRKDSVVKVELLQQIRQWHGDPYIWFDDRQQVVDAIRAAGIRVLQVSEGNF